jgi:hypothetical protein
MLQASFPQETSADSSVGVFTEDRLGAGMQYTAEFAVFAAGKL